MQIRLDANGAWSVPEAEAALRALAPAAVELCEEPVHGLEQMQELNASTDVPLAIDETTLEPGALDHRVCDAVCLKIARGGGISGVIEQPAAPAPPATRSISPQPSTVPWASPPPSTPLQ